MGILFGSFSSVQHVVTTPEGERELSFSPMSAKLLMQLRGILRPVLNSFVLFTQASPENDRQKQVEETNIQEGVQRKQTIAPVSVESARLRASQKREAVETLVQEILSEAMLKTTCLVICDSLRKDVERKDVDATAARMAENCSVEELASYLGGVAKANRKLVGPFLEKLKSMGAIFSMAAQRLADEIAPENAPGNEPQGESQPESKGTESGETSKQPS